MKNREKLEERLRSLSELERQKFDYILNFYTDEHVYYNFDSLKKDLENYSVVSCAKFVKPIEPKLKEIADNLDLSTMMGNFQSIRTFFFEPEGKNISDFLLYLLDYTDLPLERKIATIEKSRKYKDLIDNGYISAEDISKTLSSFFSKAVSENEIIDWKELERAYNIELIKIIKYNTLFLDNLEDRDSGTNKFLSDDLKQIIDSVDKEKAFKKQGGIETSNIDILFLSYIAGDKFDSLDHETIEKIKAMLRSFEFKDLKRADIELVREYFDAICYKDLTIEELYFLKNIADNEDILRVFEGLPDSLKAQVLKLNVVTTPEEIANIMSALAYCTTPREEGEKEEFPSTKYQFSKLPPEKREQLLSLIREEPLKDYKKKIGLYHPITFGFELETDGVSEKTVKEIIVQKGVANAIHQSQGIKKGITPKWAVDYDGTVLHGVEVISPVMKDDIEDWEALREVCTFLKAIGGEATDCCGGHIHIGVDVLGSNGDAWENFFKTWSASEPIIYKMSNKPGAKPRTNTLNEAGPTKPIIDELLASGEVNIKNPSDIKDLADSYTRRYLGDNISSGRSKGLNLCPIAEGKQDTIEFRIPNGNLDYVEIQRTAELYARMLDIARQMAENPEYKSDIFRKLQAGTTEEEKMIYLVDLLFDKTIDKAVFYERYFSKPKDLEIGGKKYSDVVESEVKINKHARFEWRGER